MHIYVFLQHTCTVHCTVFSFLKILRFPIRSKLWETCQKRKFKDLKNTFKLVKNIDIIPLIHNWPDRFKIKQNPAISKHYKTRGVYPFNQWNYFQRGYIDKRRSGDFSRQTRMFTFRSLFASKNIIVNIMKFTELIITTAKTIHYYQIRRRLVLNEYYKIIHYRRIEKADIFTPQRQAT